MTGETLIGEDRPHIPTEIHLRFRARAHHPPQPHHRNQQSLDHPQTHHLARREYTPGNPPNTNHQSSAKSYFIYVPATPIVVISATSGGHHIRTGKLAYPSPRDTTYQVSPIR